MQARLQAGLQADGLTDVLTDMPIDSLAHATQTPPPSPQYQLGIRHP